MALDQAERNMLQRNPLRRGGEPAMTTVALVGLAVLDRVFRVPALPQRAGKHFATDHREVVGGIAANAALAVARLGGVARLHTRVGGDATGASLLAQLTAGGVEVGHVERVAECTTSQSAVLLDASGERLIVNHKDPALLGPPPRIDLAGVDAALADLRWPAAVQALAEAARASQVPLVLDVDQAPEMGTIDLAGATHLIFGADALRALGRTDDLATALDTVQTGAPDAHLAVTVGGDGIHWRSPAGIGGHLSAHDVAVIDTLGAGDAFHGAATLALGEGRPFDAALAFANAFAALKVQRPSGPSTLPTRAETEALLRTLR